MTTEVEIVETARGQFKLQKTEQNEIRFHCKDCGHKAREEWEMPMDIRELTRRTKAMSKCKGCGGKMYMGWADAPERKIIKLAST